VTRWYPRSVATSRRSFLKKGLIGGALLALGGGALAVYPSKEVGVATAPLEALEPRAFQVLVAFASRVITASGSNPVTIAHGADHTLSYALPETQEAINKLLGLFENALPGLLFDGRLQPFTRLSAQAQDAVLESWRTSRIELRRTGYQALRKLVLAAYYMEESSWGPLAYAPPRGFNAYDDSQMGTPEWLRAQANGDAK
jgi:hypothetical protein